MPNPKITRRNALAGFGTTVLASYAAPGTGASPAAPVSTDVFMHGVASGDPEHDSVVLWTRVSGYRDAVAVRWELAGDATFQGQVSKGEFVTSAERDFTVKVVVSGLKPGKRYYYRFSTLEGVSQTGKTRTLPLGELSSLNLAVVSCSNFPFGYFNVYEAIANDSAIDWVLHLGDYIYEYGSDEWGAASGKALGREHKPAGEIVSLADYRERHAQYKSDGQSQMMHAEYPLLLIWDDHESANNPWMNGAQNHQPDKEGSWLARRQASLQAYFEWMPVRDPLKDERREDYWRHWKFGNLASLISLETRHTGRARQIELEEHAPSLTDVESADVFMRDIVGAADRPLLSPSMEKFLQASLVEARDTGVRWKLLANQIPMARTHNPRLTPEELEMLSKQMPERSFNRLREMARRGTLNLPLYLDPWDGYPRAREDLYQLARDCDCNGLLVLTGDSHSFWSNRLFNARGESVGLELGTTGVSSPGDFVEFGSRGAALVDQRLAETNAEVQWTTCRFNGYLRLQLNPQSSQADFVAVSSVTSKTFDTRVLRTDHINKSVNGELRFT